MSQTLMFQNPANKNNKGASTSGRLSMMLPMMSIVLLCLIWEIISFRVEYFTKMEEHQKL